MFVLVGSGLRVRVTFGFGNLKLVWAVARFGLKTFVYRFPGVKIGFNIANLVKYPQLNRMVDFFSFDPVLGVGKTVILGVPRVLGVLLGR